MKGADSGAVFKWKPTGAPPASQRYDDIWLLNPTFGWAVNSAGHILKTTSAAQTWDIKFRTPILPSGRPVYLRCISWADEQTGLAGTRSICGSIGPLTAASNGSR